MTESRRQIVILGGGFAGVAVARELARQLPARSADVHLVSRDNYFVFSPMLPEVAGGGIEAAHILSSLRTLCRHATVTVGTVESVDLERREVRVIHGPHEQHDLVPFDVLVLALGTVTNFSELSGMAQHALPLKTIGDAFYLRNHVIDMLEEADCEDDPELRQRLLTFVVAGGGFSGVEAVAELNDFVRGACRSYRRVNPRECRLILLHSNDRILPELGPDLAAFAHRHLEARGVEVRLNTMLGGATECEALLKGGDPLPTRTLVCTVGTAPNPLLSTLPFEKDQRGRLIVDSTLRVQGSPDVWAVGDCAAVPSGPAGSFAPPTAQFAQREGELVARNIVAAFAGRQLAPFTFEGLGQFVSLGRRAAVAQILRLKLSGFPAWFMWRTVYLFKLPGLARKTRVAMDWTLDIIFGRDLAQLPVGRADRLGHAHFEPGDMIIRQGETGDQFYVVASGEVEVVRENPGGGETLLNRLREGDFFGELALMSDAPRAATVRAVTQVNVLTLGRNDFAMLARNWKSVRSTLEATVAERTG